LAAKPDKSLGFVGELAKRSGLFDLQVKPQTPFALQTKNTGRGPPESVPPPFIAAEMVPERGRKPAIFLKRNDHDDP
jgi:hypothetical protein